MTDLPSEVEAHFLEATVRGTSLAYFLVGRDGLIRESGGEPRRFGLAGIEIGALAVDRIECLHGLLPLVGEELVLPTVLTSTDRYADVHLFPGRGGDWVIFIDSTAEATSRRLLKQQANEIALARAELQRLERSVSDQLSSDELALRSQILRDLDFAVLIGDEQGRFRELGLSPEWFQALVPAGPAGELDLEERSPFLAEFLDEAREVWTGARSGPARSGLWTETDAGGAAVRLCAAALSCAAERILIVERITHEFEERRDVVQRARDASLRARRDLAARAADVARINERLEQEVTDRRAVTDRLRSYQRKLRALAIRLSHAEVQERRRIAEGLHDEVGQLLAAAKIKIGVLQQTAGSSASAGSLVERLEEVRELVDELVGYTRTLTFELGTPLLYELGLTAALEGLAEKCEEKFGLPVHVEATGDPNLVEREISIVLYQCARELLFNVARHAKARSATVSVVFHPGRLELEVADDGCGFDPSTSSKSPDSEGGFGLFSVRERMNALGGGVEVDSAPGQGASVRLVLPLHFPTVDGESVALVPSD